MSEKQARRPPVAPKPWFIHQDAATVKISPLPSPALQGATTAFGPGPVKVSNAASSHNPSAGALLAATAAASRRSQSQSQPQPQHQGQAAQKNGPSSQDASSPSRGRQPAVRSVRPAAAIRSSASPPKPSFPPYLPQSTSTVAAVAASTATSPVRPETKEESTSSYLSKPEPPERLRQRSISTSSTYSDAGLSLQKSPEALAGAIASMTIAPAQVRGRVDESQRNDLNAISHRLLSASQPSTGSSPSPSPSGTAAAALATRNAANAEARRRAQSGSSESVTNQAYPANFGFTAPTTTGPSWPQIRLTPPETDSETDSLRAVEPPEAASETPRKPLPAPTPLKPARAAIVAQDNANPRDLESPVLDARTKMTASSLADAMVASSLASKHSASRVASPASKPPPPPPPKSRRRSRSATLFEGGKQHLPFLGRGSETTPPTPKPKPRIQRPMRQTMRSQSPNHHEKEDEHSKRGRRHWRRHPNMHHEGDRKRWRDRVTERERKRYEGVWAANRGLLNDIDLAILEPEPEQPEQVATKNAGPPGDLVANVVVRDIWERSRLPKDVLEEVWDLVARPGAKALNREEFVVGLWLIDQRLKGRKLPIRVSPSVWQSVRHPQGVKIRNKRR
ncbi:hypothetical protein A1O3_04843 [Capronia epimyces CBS 606.96]|uniref:EH domain-containing protein n=1 Tax=Capronia epimyces CBS 606.96 TaxID=1182542 RepID=W9Y4M2_9EURO|nr:uncharacterized protein A1O3_04843 [Capronia epimyces CBS 606.96]EXJ84176.1 hypothetical protein A1O3_04843 [Capronia epimyces CBS 606.96]